MLLYKLQNATEKVVFRTNSSNQTRRKAWLMVWFDCDEKFNHVKLLLKEASHTIIMKRYRFCCFKASVHSFKRLTSRLLKLSFSLSMHLLLRMNVMLDFIWTLPVQLRGIRNLNITKNLAHGRIRTTNTARHLDYKSGVITTRPQLAWYTVSQEPQCVRFRCVLTCSPIV